MSTPGSGVGVGEGDAGVAVGPATIGGVGVGIGVAVGVGVGIGVAVGVGVGGTGVAVGVFVGRGAGVGSGSSPHATKKRAVKIRAMTRDVTFMERRMGMIVAIEAQVGSGRKGDGVARSYSCLSGGLMRKHPSTGFQVTASYQRRCTAIFSLRQAPFDRLRANVLSLTCVPRY